MSSWICKQTLLDRTCTSKFVSQHYVRYLNCSRECAFLGFHSTSEIQFFWRWNISPSSLLVNVKCQPKKQDTLLAMLFGNEGRHVWFSTFHVTWWNRDWPAENWRVLTWRSIWHVRENFVFLFLYFVFNFCSYLDRDFLTSWCPSQEIA